MSLAYNLSLTSFGTTNLPLSLSYLSLNYSPVEFVPTVPTGVLASYASSCSLADVTMQSITSQLVVNGLTSGSLDITGNGTPNGTTLTNISTLQSSGWSVLYDT